VDWKECGVKHQKEDADRITREKAEAEQATIRANALKKLTPAERIALGLGNP